MQRQRCEKGGPIKSFSVKYDKPLDELNVCFSAPSQRTMYFQIVDLSLCGEGTSISEAFLKVSSSGSSKVVKMLATVLEIAAAKLS